MPINRSGVRIESIAIAILIFGVTATIMVLIWPKKMLLSHNPNAFTGYYWGNDLLGKHFYRVEVNDGEYGHWEVDVKGPGYNSYRGYYVDGTLREEGEINVIFRGIPSEPQPDNSDVKWGRYYRPDGTLGVEIIDGTGEQMFWYPSGKPRWKLVLKNNKRVTYDHWTESGELISHEDY